MAIKPRDVTFDFKLTIVLEGYNCVLTVNQTMFYSQDDCTNFSVVKFITQGVFFSNCAICVPTKIILKKSGSL